MYDSNQIGCTTVIKSDQVSGTLWNSKAMYFRSDYQQP